MARNTRGLLYSKAVLGRRRALMHPPPHVLLLHAFADRSGQGRLPPSLIDGAFDGCLVHAFEGTNKLVYKQQVFFARQSQVNL